MRDQYYDKAAMKLNIEKGTKDWKWLTIHIKILDLYTIERACYTSKNLILAMEKTAESADYNDYSILQYLNESDRFTDEGINSFMDKVTEDVACLAREMHEKKII